MTISVNAASEVLRDAMRETVKKHSLWFLIQGGLMVLAGIVARKAGERPHLLSHSA